MHIVFLTWNVHKCKGADGRRDPGRILSVIASHAPDVAVLQEVDMKFGQRRGILDPDSIFGSTGMTVHLPDTPSRGAVGWHGNALLMRTGIRCDSAKTIALPSLEPRGAVLWSLESEGVQFEVVGMHLGLVGAWRKKQAARIAAEIAARKPVPTIVAGDMNDWSPRSDMMKPLEYVLGTQGMRPRTFPARLPLLRLDRVLAGRGASVHKLVAASAAKASDHLPLVTEIGLS